MKHHHLELQSDDCLEPLKALASDTRLRILRTLACGPMNIHALGQALGISQPNITKHVQVLDQVGLISTEYAQGTQGMQKLCRLRYDRIGIAFEAKAASEEDRVHVVEMPVGLYTASKPTPTCGLASNQRIIGYYDDPQSFFHPERGGAQILWMAEGYVEYAFPNGLPTSAEVTWLELAMEVCSEAPAYQEDYPSDITVWVNGAEIGTWTSPGDFGAKRGRLNPAWWSECNTQYGVLKVWSVDAGGSYVDAEPAAGVRMADLNLLPREPITVRIGVKPDAENQGGFNLFGRGFGNYEQDLALRLHYETRRK